MSVVVLDWTACEGNKGELGACNPSIFRFENMERHVWIDCKRRKWKVEVLVGEYLGFVKVFAASSTLIVTCFGKKLA